MRPTDDLQVLLDEARHDAAVGARIRRRWLRTQLVEEASFLGVLLDLADAPQAVTLWTATGQVHRGRLSLVAPDHVVVTTGRGSLVVVATRALTQVRPEPGVATAVAAGTRVGARDRLLAETLGRLAAERPDVVARSVGTDAAVRGALVAVGRDVATVVAEGTPVFVAVASLAELVVPDGAGTFGTLGGVAGG